MSDEDLRVPFLRSEEPTSFEGPRKEMSAKNVRNFFPIVEQKVGKPRYKLVTFFHCAFKLTSFTLYLVSNIMGLSYVMTFVTITILLSADFWLVKNVSGRLLAGLRWWNVVDETSGNQVSWKFESWTSEDRQLASKSQIHIFWLGLILQEVIWILLGMVAMFSLKLNWFILTIFALALNSANLVYIQ